MTTALDCLKEVSASLRSYGIEDTDKESELILTDCLTNRNGLDRLLLYRDNPLLSEVQEKEISSILARRSQREPLQYITGHAGFYGLNIKVGQGVLIPRPETELLVEEAIKVISIQHSAVSRQPLKSKIPNSRRAYAPTVGLSENPKSKINILDLCTGSGCIALAFARHLPDAAVYGTDISQKALAYAGENASTNYVQNITFLCGDLYQPVEGLKFDIIVSNPPYIKTEEINCLQPEIREWEPVAALDGGEDGLRYYRDILNPSAGYLKDGGCLLVETGAGQAQAVLEIAEATGLRCEAVIKDYAGIERVLRFSLSCNTPEI